MTETNKSDLYSSFLQDLYDKEPRILPDDQIRQRIAVVRDSSSTEEQKLAARNDIVESSLRTIPFVIKRLPNTDIPPEELVGEAFETINSCIDNFDPTFISPKTEDKVNFSTYLIVSLSEGLRSPRTVSRVGESFSTSYQSDTIAGVMRKARELFMQEEHREPTQDEWYKRTVRLAGETRAVSTLKQITLGTFTGVERGKLRKHPRLGKRVSRGNVDPDTLSVKTGVVEERVIDESVDVIEEAAKELLEKDMEEVLATLSPRERRVIELRYGLGLNEEGKKPEPLKLQQIGEMFGTNRERIRQIETKALRKLRHPDRARKVRDYLEVDAGLIGDIQKEFENRYRQVIQNFSFRLLKSHDREKIIDFLHNLRKGSKDVGMIDEELLKNFLDASDVFFLRQSEREYYISSRTIVKDTLDTMNEEIELLKSGYEFRGNPTTTLYWRRSRRITMDEVKQPPQSP